TLISLLYNALTCSLALRIVAVDAIILGETPLAEHNKSTAVSYNPTIVPNGPDIKCNSSCIINSGDRTSDDNPNMFLTSCFHGRRANLSTVPKSSVGGFL